MNNIVSILGVQKELIPIKRDKLRGLNADMLLRFSFYTIDFNNQRITKQVEAVMNMPVVVLLDSLTYYERERLINQEVYFIISDKYAFLPSLIVNVQAKKRDKNPMRLTPAAQYVLLYYLLDEKNENEFTIKKLEEIVPYNYVTLARAVIKFIRFSISKRELWTKAQSYLSSPVKKTLYCDVVPKGNFSISGINALSHYSHLNPEQNGTFAIWEKQFNPTNGRYNEIEGLHKIEIWKYPVTIPYQLNGGIVDKLSLYLSMKGDPDSRIEKELEIMIEEIKW